MYTWMHAVHSTVPPALLCCASRLGLVLGPGRHAPRYVNVCGMTQGAGGEGGTNGGGQALGVHARRRSTAALGDSATNTAEQRHSGARTHDAVLSPPPPPLPFPYHVACV